MKIIKILKKYLENQASPEEIKDLSEWLDRTETDDKDLQNFIMAEWTDYVAESDSAPELDEVLSSINQRINIEENRGAIRQLHQEKVKKLKKWRFIGAAAAVLILACTIWWVKVTQKNDTAPQYITEVKSNPKGQKSTIVLSDGSRVKLNADSELSYPETFESNKRTVYLKGEAFFEVAKDASRPFTVITENITTTALGTSFNVRAFPGQSEIEVSLATGIVKVTDQKSSKKQHVYLEPNEQATFSKAHAALSKDSLDITESLAWKEGVLIFNEADLNEVKEKLERWFNVVVKVNNSEKWGARAFTGRFDNESLEHVLEGMSYSSKFGYKIDGRRVTIDL